jgi:hypothetical protein
MTESMLFLAALGGTVFARIVWQPLFGAWLFLLASPLIAGIGRGTLGAVLRPNEALLLFILAALGVRALLLMLSGRYRPAAFDSMDWALLALAGTGSVLPLLWREARDLPLSSDDILYALVLVKYYALFRLFRGTVADNNGVATCLFVSVLAAVVVATIGILQVSQQFGVAGLLHAYYDDPFQGTEDVVTGRATSTIASPFGTADVLIFNLLTVLALRRTAVRYRSLLNGAAVLLVLGCVATGTFSAYIGLAVALLVFGAFTGTVVRLLAAATAMAAIGTVALWPVVAARLAGFGMQSGLPHSWEGRWSNLQRFFLPRLGSGANWLFGVQPVPRVPAPETWRTLVYIESGYVWLLWIGGLPFVAAFFCFIIVALRRLGRVARSRSDAVGCAAISSFCSVVVMTVLMLFDPHLTMRGAADIFFPMLALSLAPSRRVLSAETRFAPPASQMAGTGQERILCGH